MTLLDDPLILIFVVLFVGSLIGQLEFKGINLGASGVLLFAMVLGHYGYKIPAIVQNLGLSLFIVAVGLQAGPRFFRMMRSSGLVFAVLGFLIIAIASVTTIFVSKVFNLSAPLSIGLMTGALTSTPGLAAGLEATKDPIVSVGYGIAYPFGVIAVVLFVQLFPKVLKVDLQKDLQKTLSPIKHKSSLKKMTIMIESNNVHKKTLKELQRNIKSSAVISRVIRGDRNFLGRNDTVLLIGDEIIAVGYPEDLIKLRDAIGREVTTDVNIRENIRMHRVVVDAQELIGKSLREINLREKYSVTVTRLERAGYEFPPTATWRLERGDVLTVVCSPERIKAVEELFGTKRHEEANIHIFSISLILLLGILVGMIPIHIPGLGSMTLGVAGGPLLIAIIIGHFGKLGPIQARFYQPSNRVIRDVGLVLFLAGAGTTAGGGLVEVVKQEGVGLIIGGAIITIVPMVTAFFIAKKLFHLSIIHSLGAICGGMTSTPGLGACNNLVDSEDPAIAYAAAYPIALIFVAIASQLLVLIL
ncbi:aspartate:alanine exchanger family transporter [Anaerobacillus isosaccharinicus]|uniref:YidE/YbjL duplication n=1 Tax=Anaerobacillus isosaccharinicus TaxID=1532552 RepID=A0A1S2LFS8_9BACI|nr:TrkA C-terminal domain-containing protein [Anaerobacillus isosaccharinicus]MBA5588685.1 YidE/YbjL duplication [Anaerobacillus isosaccharinicus]QOY37912.1 YidE/YbjL duplication [Anaerobacillus isosaccharinicus]